MSDPLVWAGGEHPFQLRIAELRALQEKCDAGPNHVAERLMGLHGGWRVDDIVQPLRLGLIGGGMAPSQAGPLVLKIFEEAGAARLRPAAYAVLMQSILGPEDDPPGEAEAGETSASDSPAAGSGSPSSTAAAP